MMSITLVETASLLVYTVAVIDIAGGNEDGDDGNTGGDGTGGGGEGGGDSTMHVPSSKVAAES